MQTVTKEVVVTKLYDSNMDADIEARQFASYPDMLDRMTPAPRTWRVTGTVKKADVYRSDDPREKARVELTVTAVGEEKNIDSWVIEYNRLHNRQAEEGPANRRALNEAAEKKRKEREARG